MTMGRYDWPPGPRTKDDPQARSEHLAWLRPAVDVSTLPAPPSPAARPGANRAMPHNAPSGNQYLWTPIGPTTMTHGQAGGSPNVAGRIRDLAIEPHQGNRVYAASAGGGIWLSLDRGESWRPLDEWQVSDRGSGRIANSLACGAIYVEFGAAGGDGTDDVVWVGTGEPALTRDGQLGRRGEEKDGDTAAPKQMGVGFLTRDPAVAGGAWQIVKGDPPATDPETLRGEACYRITADPASEKQLIAATTRGLYLKPRNAGWTRITSFHHSVQIQPMDVVLTRPSPTTLRIWVAVASKVMVAEVSDPIVSNVNAATFTDVALPGVATVVLPLGAGTVGTCLQLAADGGTVYVLGRSNTKVGKVDKPAALWTVNATAALPGLSGTALNGTPTDLFMSAGDQSDYDMCIATHPTAPGRVYLGGAAAATSTGWNGAIYRWDTTTAHATPTLVGERTHSDVHVLRVGPVSPTSAPKRTIWAGTDGGVFRSDADADAGTFVACNTGLAVLQPGYIANHPTNPGLVVAGFQDNGTAVRDGDGVWRQTFAGDGGGVVYDPNPAHPNRYYRQYVMASWNSSDGGGVQPVKRHNAREVNQVKTSEELEDESSNFYTSASAIFLGGDTHLVLGTDRVWYSRDWGRNWVTLPSGIDPRGSDDANVLTDVLAQDGNNVNFTDRIGSVESCSTNHPGVGGKGLGIIATRIDSAPNDGSGHPVLRVLALYSGGLVWFTGTRTAASGPFAWAPPPMTRQQIKDPILRSADEAALQHGQPMTFLPAPGIVSDVCVHDRTRGTLGSCYVTTTGQWFNGSAGWLPRDTLWFFDGTSRWFPTGLSTSFNGTWATPTDRITAPGLGVVVDESDLNTVYVATAVGVVRGTLTVGGTAAAPTYQWAWQQMMNGLPEAAVQDLAIFDSGGVKLLRAALQARGVWEVDLATPAPPPVSFLRTYRTDTRRKLPTAFDTSAVTGDPEDPPSYDNSPDIVLDVSSTAYAVPPSEAQLQALPRLGSPDVQTKESLSQRQFKVHVLPHHRVADLSIARAQLRVALMWKPIAADGVTTLDGVWPALVAAAGAGSPPASLPGGWLKAGAALWQNPTVDVDPRLPRAVTFDVDFAGQPTSTAIMLVAVVLTSSSGQIVTAAEIGAAHDVQGLVTASPRVAAKAVMLE